MFGFSKEPNLLKDLKKANEELELLLKEIKKEAKEKKLYNCIEDANKVSLALDYKSVLFSNLNNDQLTDLLSLTSIMKLALLDAQELLRKGTEYGVKLALDRVNNLQADRRVIKSPYLIETYKNFDASLWGIIKLRELCYGEIQRLKAKQDNITMSALKETDGMMRVRYFEDIRILEKDILRLENEAHQYHTEELALRNEKVLKNILKQYSTPKEELPSLIEFEKNVLKYDRKENK